MFLWVPHNWWSINIRNKCGAKKFKVKNINSAETRWFLTLFTSSISHLNPVFLDPNKNFPFINSISNFHCVFFKTPIFTLIQVTKKQLDIFTESREIGLFSLSLFQTQVIAFLCTGVLLRGYTISFVLFGSLHSFSTLLWWSLKLSLKEPHWKSVSKIHLKVMKEY